MTFPGARLLFLNSQMDSRAYTREGRTTFVIYSLSSAHPYLHALLPHFKLKQEEGGCYTFLF